MALPPLWPVAQALLALIEDTFAAEHVDLPGRRYITAGAATSTVWDCEQLVVGMLQMSALPAGVGAGAEVSVLTPAHPGMILPPSVQLLAELVRDHPIPAPARGAEAVPPSPAQEMCAAEISLTDAACLHRCAVMAMKNGLTAGPGQVSYAGVEPAGPEGGASAQRLRVSATLL